MKRKTHEQYVEELSKINPNIEVLGQYKNAITKIEVRCLIDGYRWYVRPSNLLNGTGCPKCAIERQKITKKNKKIKRHRKSHEQFIEDLRKINPNIEVLDEYKSAKSKIEVRCLIDGYRWYVAPSNLLTGRGCPICSRTKKKTQEEFIQELKQISPNIEVIDIYVNSTTKIKVKCLLDGCIWNVVPNSLLRGTRCPICSGNKKKTQEEFIQELKQINPNIEIIGKYKNAKTKIKVRCLIDGYIWNVVPDSLHSGYGCPVCCASKGEKKIEKYLKDNNYKYFVQYKINGCKNKNPLPFDFAVFKENKLMCLIEYQGEQHYKEVDYFGGIEGFKCRQKNDEIKRNYCLANNIVLLEIPYWEKKVEEYLNERLLKIEELKEVNN